MNFQNPSAAKSTKWGLSEAELFISRGAGEGEFEAIVGPAEEAGSENVVRRNLIIGIGLAVAAGVLAFVRFHQSTSSTIFFSCSFSLQKNFRF